MTSTAATMFASILMLAVTIWSVGRLFGRRQVGRRETVRFFGIVFLAMLLLRWPQITWQHELNADESQMLAQGMRFAAHPIPWRDVDGMTGGPLDSQVLTGLIYLGAPASWETARIFLWALNCVTVVLLYLAMRCFGSRAEAQFILLPTILFYAFAVHQDFIHYSSETLPVALLAAGIYFLAREGMAEQLSKGRCFWLGFFAGAIPFTKIQAAPLGLLLVMAGLALVITRRHSQSKKDRWQAAIILVIGVIVVPVLILGVVAIGGAIEEFWFSYVLASAAYVGQEGFITKEMHLERVLFGPQDFLLFFCGTAGMILFLPMAWLFRKTRLNGSLGWPLLVAVAYFGLTLGCLLAAGKDYYHYALLLVPALTILFGTVFLAGKAMLAKQDGLTQNISVRSGLWLVLFSLMSLAMLWQSYALYRRDLLRFRDELLRRGSPAMSLVSQRILTASRPGDTMSVWGWMPAYHVETGIPPATRAVIGYYVINKSPEQTHSRKLYLKDLEKSRPAWFIDAIGDNTFQWYWINPDKHEKFPELEQFINDNYDLWLSIHMTNQTAIGAPIRIYALKQRMAESHLSPAELSAPADPHYLGP